MTLAANRIPPFRVEARRIHHSGFRRILHVVAPWAVQRSQTDPVF